MAAWTVRRRRKAIRWPSLSSSASASRNSSMRAARSVIRCFRSLTTIYYEPSIGSHVIEQIDQEAVEADAQDIDEEQDRGFAVVVRHRHQDAPQDVDDAKPLGEAHTEIVLAEQADSQA